MHSAASHHQIQPDSISPPLPTEPLGDYIAEERRVETYSASLLDHEYTAGPGPFGPGGPRGSAAMAPGVFLTSRRHSLSPQNSSSYSPSAPSPAGMASPGAAGIGQGKHKRLLVVGHTKRNSSLHIWSVDEHQVKHHIFNIREPKHQNFLN